MRAALAAALLVSLLLPAPAAAGARVSGGETVDLPTPVICVHGFRGDATTFEGALEPMRAAGLEPLPLTFVPTSGAHGIAETARGIVGPMIDDALAGAGYPEGQRFHVLAHSLGGLAIRQLAEREGWDERIGRVVLLAVPNHGARTGLAGASCGLPTRSPWRGCGCDTRRGSPFLADLGTSPPAELAARYLSIGSSWRGTPMPGGGDLDGSGRGHANDGVVATESPHLDGVPLRIWKGRGPSRHTRLCCNSVVVEWITGFLAHGTLPEELAYPRAEVAADLCASTGSGEPPRAADGVDAVPADAGWVTLRVDAGPAVDPLVQFKIRDGHLQVFVDGEPVVDRSERRAPRGEAVFTLPLAPGDHQLSVRWDVVFRSATDRHLPASSLPDEVGFSVPAEGFASRRFEVAPGGPLEIVVRLHRKATVGIQGDTWVEFVVGAE